MEKLNKLQMDRYRVEEGQKRYGLSHPICHSSAITTVAKVTVAIAPIATRLNKNGCQKDVQEILEAQFLGANPNE